MPLWLVDFLSSEGIYKGSFSKYGAAVAWQLEQGYAYGALTRVMPQRRPTLANEGMRRERRRTFGTVPTFA